MSELVQRSTFVTVVAWIFIVISGFMTLISILQNIMIFSVMGGAGMSEAMTQPPPGMNGAAAMVFSHIQWLFPAFLVIASLTLISSIGLLRRWNWARLCFVGLMILGIAWHVFGMVFQFLFMSSMQASFPHEGMHGAPDMRMFFIATMVVSVIMAVGFSVLFGWIAKRLLSAPIAEEFRR